MSLDASTTTVGLAVIDYDETNMSIAHFEYYKPDKSGHQLDMLIKAKEYLNAMLNTFHPHDLAIEEYVSFMKGNSTAATIVPLAVFNRTLCLAAYEKMNKLPSIINVNTVRSRIKLSKERPKKEDVPDVVAKHLNIDFPWFTKQTKKGATKTMVESYDVADAMAVGIAFILKFGRNNGK